MKGESMPISIARFSPSGNLFYTTPYFSTLFRGKWERILIFAPILPTKWETPVVGRIAMAAVRLWGNNGAGISQSPLNQYIMYDFMDLLHRFNNREKVQRAIIANFGGEPNEDRVTNPQGTTLDVVLSKSFVFGLTPEGGKYWWDIWEELRQEATEPL